MAEVIGVVGSIVGILQLTGVVVGYLNSVKEASNDCNRLMVEISSTSGLLHGLKALLAELETDETTWSATIRSLASPNSPLDQLRATLERLSKHLKPLAGLKLVGRSLVWPFKKGEVKDILRAVERQKNSLILALQNDHIGLSRAIQMDIARLYNGVDAIKNGISELQVGQNYIEAQLRDDERHKIEAWLSPLNFALKQNDTLCTRQIGTGQWLLEQRAFKDWLDGSNKILWCPGIPGAGKTVLTSTIIDHLQLEFEDRDVGIAYAYCSYREPDQTAANLISSLLQQLVIKQRGMNEKIHALYSTHSRRKSRPSLEDFMELLHFEVRRLSTVFIVIDALDECSEDNGTRLTFLDSVLSLIPHVRLLITSRHIGTIQQELQHEARIEIQATDHDIRAYIRGRCMKERRLRHNINLDSTLQQSILDSVVHKAQGMFLLAHLYMQSLARKHTRRDIRETLENLPREIDGVYAEAMQTIKGQPREDADLAMKVLLWTAFAIRPMNIQELQHAVAIELGKAYLNEDALPPEDLLQSVCAGLVCIGSERNTVRLVHYTTRDYFVRLREVYFPDLEALMAKTCLRYISFTVFSKPVPWPKYNDFVFLSYAAEHLFSAPSPELDDMDDEFTNLAIQFLRDPESIANILNSMHISIISPGLTFGVPRVLPPAHMATWLGFKKPLLNMLKPRGDLDVNMADEYGQTITMYAAYFGRHSILKSLLDLGATLRSIETHDLISELHYATRAGHLKTVEVILDSGVAPDELRDPFGQTALTYTLRSSVFGFGSTTISKPFEALRSLKLRIVSLLLDHGANVNHKDHLGRHVLILAVTLRHTWTAIVLLLLKYGADVNVCSNDGMSALSIASKNRQGDMIRLLRSHGAKLEGRVSHLFAAISSNEIKLVQQSLEAGADVNCAYGEDLHLPLQHAIDCASDIDIVQLLLSYGAKVDLINDEGYTTLHYAVMEGKEEIFALLVKHVDGVNVEDLDGWTPLHWAASDRGHEKILRILLDNGASNLNRIGLHGRTPLHWAVRFSYDGTIIRKMLQNGADLLIRDDDGNTSLTYAVERGLCETVEILLENLDSLDCTIGKKMEIVETARLQALANVVHEPGERSYISQFADAATRMFQYRSNLMGAENNRLGITSSEKRVKDRQRLRLENLKQLEALKLDNPENMSHEFQTRLHRSISFSMYDLGTITIPAESVLNRKDTLMNRYPYQISLLPYQILLLQYQALLPF